MKIKKYIFMFMFIFSISFSKLDFTEISKENRYGYSNYILQTNSYSKEKDFLDFFNKAKELQSKEHVNDVNVVLQIVGESYYADRITFINKRYFLYSNDDGIELYLNESEYLRERKGNDKNNYDEPDELKYRLAVKRDIGDRMVLKITTNKKKEITYSEMSKIASEIFEKEKLSNETFIHPFTKTTEKYREYTFIFYLDKQYIESETNFSLEMTN